MFPCAFELVYLYKSGIWWSQKMFSNCLYLIKVDEYIRHLGEKKKKDVASVIPLQLIPFLKYSKCLVVVLKMSTV